MTIFLWILQILLAVHTAIGAVWKLTNPAQTIPSLQAIPHPAWLALSGLEILCALCLLAPIASKGMAVLVPVAVLMIGAEMLLFCALHLATGAAGNGQMIYWFAISLVCAFLAYGRLVASPATTG